jgi:hypothetical protein
MTVSKRLLLPMPVLLLVSLPPAVVAQITAAGSISGIVRDSQGAVIPGARVTALNQNQDAVLGVAITDIAGAFLFNPLPAPAKYTLTVEAAGFKRYSQADIALDPGAQRGLSPFVLEVGSISESVVVEANAVQLETVSATRSQTVSQQQLAELPVSSRTNFATAYLREVNGNPPDATGSFNGQPAVQQTVQIDGVTTMDMGNASGNFSWSMEAIGEVKVSTNSMGAEYGRSSGFQVTSVLKSGSKDFHGSGYWYHKNEGLNANTWTNNFQGIQKPISRSMLSGFTIGGPAWMPVGPLNKLGRNRVFFFANFEFDPQKSNSLVTLTVPTAAQVSGNFAGVLNNVNQPVVVKDPLNGLPFPGNVIPPDRISPYGQGLLKLINTIDPPNITGQPTYNYQKALPIAARRTWQDIYKFDWNVTANNRISVHLMRYHNHYDTYGGGNLNWSVYSFPDGERSIAVNYVRIISPTMTNEMNIGEARIFYRRTCRRVPARITKGTGPGGVPLPSFTLTQILTV